jgi:hypothetical protein
MEGGIIAFVVCVQEQERGKSNCLSLHNKSFNDSESNTQLESSSEAFFFDCLRLEDSVQVRVAGT